MGFQKKTLFLVVASVMFILSNAQLSNRDRIIQNSIKSRKLPSLDVCGKSVTAFEQKIINGSPAELGEFPWMANIGYGRSETQSPQWLCGGSLITDQYVITAAHCLHPASIKSLKVIAVRLGELDLNPSVNDGASPQDFKVEKTTYHQQYDNTRKVNDIGLIKLRDKVTFSDQIVPICLPPPEFQTNLFVGYFPTVAGWGRSETNSTRSSTHLLKAEVGIKSTEECRQNITSAASLRNAIIDSKVICASAPGKDSCQGDSGGPLMFFRKIRKSGNMFLMGVVSYGYYCARESYPGVYVRVSHYMEWIVDNLEI